MSAFDRLNDLKWNKKLNNYQLELYKFTNAEKKII